MGGFHATRDAVALRTVLGSCIGVCLYDPVARVGGLNHFMLPGHDPKELLEGRYGLQAMELLINACMGLGGMLSRMQIKVFGGAHMLAGPVSESTVSQRNIRFICAYLETESLTASAMDVGGLCARELYFLPDCGRTLLKRVSDVSRSEIRKVVTKERAMLTKKLWAVQDDSNVTLF